LSASFFGEIASLGEEAKFEIFSRCKSHLDDADIVIALLHGSQVDDGDCMGDRVFPREEISRTENYRD
jgi:hypothetical protein